LKSGLLLQSPPTRTEILRVVTGATAIYPQLHNNLIRLDRTRSNGYSMFRDICAIALGRKYKVTPAELEKLIAKARDEQWSVIELRGAGITALPESICELTNLTKLYLYGNKLERLPESIGQLTNLTELLLHRNQLKYIPDSIGNLTKLTKLGFYDNQLRTIPESIGNLTNLSYLDVEHNQLEGLPESIGNLTEIKLLCIKYNQLKRLPNSIGCLTNLTELNLSTNKLNVLPDSIGQLINLKEIDVSNNQLMSIPESIEKLIKLKKIAIGRNQLIRLPQSLGRLTNLAELELQGNQLTILPEFIGHLKSLISINLNDNPLTDLSILKHLSRLKKVLLFNSNLPRRYWSNISKWESKWILDEKNTEIKKILITQIGYDRISQEIDATIVDSWREYTLLKIDKLDQIIDRRRKQPHLEPLLLLKMTCPSTAHIHILRVPPDMKSAEAAITWINHGIHPDDIAVQT
jgi:leucine-rich repeat protein SHOC2